MWFLPELLPHLASESVTGMNNASYNFDMFNKPPGSHLASQTDIKLLILVKMCKPQNKVMNSMPLQSEPQDDVLISALWPVNVNALLWTQRHMWLPETIHLRLLTSNNYLM
jgi:hypothetical protein